MPNRFPKPVAPTLALFLFARPAYPVLLLAGPLVTRLLFNGLLFTKHLITRLLFTRQLFPGLLATGLLAIRLLATGLLATGLLATGLCARSLALTVVDDSGHRIKLNEPAVRVISLAPHTTEMLFSAGIGDKIVGVVEYSNYPEQANRIPQVGSSNQFDFERIAQLQPDLIVGWQSGNPANLVARLKRMGFTVYLSEPRTLEDITSNIERLAQLAGTQHQVKKVVSGFEDKVSQLRRRYSNKEQVTVFYEIWNDPLMTLGREHLFSELLALCGGKNIFSDISSLAPQISRESVIARNPQVILAGGMGSDSPQWLDEWRKWHHLDAVKNHHLYFINPDFLQRASLRLAIGAEQLCTFLDAARSSDLPDKI